MPRALTTQMAAALSSPLVRPALLVSMVMANETYYLWSGLGNMIWNAMTFLGVGSLGAISTISEDSSIEAKNVTVNLSGIPSDLVAEVLTETRLLGAVNIWLMLIDGSGNIIPAPFLAYQGKMDKPLIDDDGSTCTCSIQVESVLVDLNRSCFRRYTNDDQQLDLAATLTTLALPANTLDTAFRWVPTIAEKVTFWGSKPSSVNNQ